MHKDVNLQLLLTSAVPPVDMALVLASAPVRLYTDAYEHYLLVDPLPVSVLAVSAPPTTCSPGREQSVFGISETLTVL
jgi:hypothetical protein